MKDRVINALRIIAIILLFPLFLVELGRFIDDMYDPTMYGGGD